MPYQISEDFRPSGVLREGRGRWLIPSIFDKVFKSEL